MPLLETKGAASAQGFGLTLQQAAANYIEDVFSTWLYTGNSSTQTITNGIDLSTKGGLVWVKNRSNSLGVSHYLVDTVRGEGNYIQSNSTGANTYRAGVIGGFSTTGFSVDASANTGTNLNSNTYASWTFRKQPKFFDVVTYTGNGATSRNINHSLAAVPRFIIVKRTDSTGNWCVGHYDVGPLRLNSTAAAGLSNASDGRCDAVSTTQFSVGSADYSTGSVSDVNANGGTYVAYLFAHNAGGFGLTGTDNVITCGSFTADGSGNATISNLGYEPQWVLIKSVDFTDGWYLLDNMRGWAANGVNYLVANSSNAEVAGSSFSCPTANGFVFNYGAGANNKNFIYIAIRRGPMKTPTTGTSVFDADLLNGRGTVTTGFPVDWTVYAYPSATGDRNAVTRLIGGTRYLVPNTTVAEYDLGSNIILFDRNTSIYNDYNNINTVYWNFRRAPGFFDVVCYTGTGSARTVTHNLGVAPELMIIKIRNNTSSWFVWGGNMPITNSMFLNQTQESLDSAPYFNDTLPTASVFSVSSAANFNGETLVAYLFASCPGVSKVGSYTGTGALQTINCGFTGGARFVLVKATSTTGDWYVWDSARGISSSTDPYLLLNSTAAEVTGTNWVDTTSTGFQVTAASGNLANTNGVSYIFLAVA